jgi:hypothetical protein
MADYIIFQQVNGQLIILQVELKKENLVKY